MKASNFATNRLPTFLLACSSSWEHRALEPSSVELRGELSAMVASLQVAAIASANRAPHRRKCTLPPLAGCLLLGRLLARELVVVGVCCINSSESVLLDDVIVQLHGDFHQQWHVDEGQLQRPLEDPEAAFENTESPLYHRKYLAVVEVVGVLRHREASAFPVGQLLHSVTMEDCKVILCGNGLYVYF